MNFIEKITGIITNPKETMKNIAQEPLIEEAVMIVGIYAILSALTAYVQSSKVTYVIEGSETVPSSEGFISIIVIVSGLLGAFIIWLIGTGIIHLLSMALGGEGKFSPQMMTIVSYSMIPLIFGGIIVLLLLFTSEPMIITISRTNPMAVKELYNTPNYIASTVIGLLAQIWFTVLLFFGLQSAQKLTPAKSAVVALIPLAISVIVMALSLLSMGIL